MNCGQVDFQIRLARPYPVVDEVTLLRWIVDRLMVEDSE